MPRLPRLVRDRRGDRRAQARAVPALPRGARAEGGRRPRWPTSSSTGRGADGAPTGSAAPTRLPRRRRRAEGRGARGGLRAAGARKGRGRDRRRGCFELAHVSVRSSAARSTRRTSATSRSRGRDRALRARRLLVRVVADPGHKRFETAAADRLELARLAFAGRRGVVLDEHPCTVDVLAATRLGRPGLPDRRRRVRRFPGLEGAERVLELARLGVATRPGLASARERSSSRPERALRARAAPVASTEIRARLGARRADRRPGRPAVAADIAARSLPDALETGSRATMSALTSLEQARRSPRSPGEAGEDVVILDMRPVCATRTSSSLHRRNPRQTKAI